MKTMRYIALAMIALLLFCGAAGIASAGQTGPAKWDNYSGIPFIDQLREDAFGHTASYTDRYNDYERHNPMGIGLDAIVYEFEGSLYDYGFDSISVDQTYDFANGEYSVFGKCNYNIWRLVKPMFGNND